MENTRSIVIMVDDDITNLTVARNQLSEDYEVFTAPSGKKLLQLLEKLTPALILLDIEMPEMDGYEVIKLLKKAERTARIPVIFLTAKTDPASEVKGLELGAVDYILKPYSRELLLKRVALHILLEAQKQELKAYSQSLEGEVYRKSQVIFELQNVILKTVAELVEYRDRITGGHIERTQRYLRLLLDFLLEHGVYAKEVSSWGDGDLVVLSSQLHDVGKISIRDNILLKPGKLTDAEFDEMKKHTIFGMEIIGKIQANTQENDFLKHAKILAVSHHEKWNGTGYPYGLKGQEIPLQGRLMAIADAYDALTNERPYKKALSHEESVEIIKDGMGSHFDPLLDEIFLMHNNEFKNATVEIGHWGISFKPSSFNGFDSAVKTITDIVDITDAKKSGQAERRRRYLMTLFNAMRKHERFKGEAFPWDVDVFLGLIQAHDVGKTAMADHILNRIEKLTDEELADINNHAELGLLIVRHIKENVDEEGLLYRAEALAGGPAADPDSAGGKKPQLMPLWGQVLAIVSVYDALTHDRLHWDMIAHQPAVEIIKNLGETYLDPELVETFLGCEKDFESVKSAGTQA